MLLSYYNVSLFIMYPTSILSEKDNSVFNIGSKTHFQSCAKKISVQILVLVLGKRLNLDCHCGREPNVLFSSYWEMFV